MCLASNVSTSRSCAVSCSLDNEYNVEPNGPVYQSYISWQGAEQDELFQSAGAELIARIRDYADSIGADCPYLYLDYADGSQDPLASYGAENVEKMKVAAAKYDPRGVFQHLVPGGFKISKVL